MSIDNRKLSTADVLCSGILDKPFPKSAQPEDIELVHVDEDEGEEAWRAGLEKNGITASMYYGCWSIWKTPGGFSGELMQYRNVTDSFADRPLEVALEKAGEWHAASYG